jgi:hypothetical protein
MLEKPSLQVEIVRESKSNIYVSSPCLSDEFCRFTRNTTAGEFLPVAFTLGLSAFGKLYREAAWWRQ